MDGSRLCLIYAMLKVWWLSTKYNLYKGWLLGWSVGSIPCIEKQIVLINDKWKCYGFNFAKIITKEKLFLSFFCFVG